MTLRSGLPVKSFSSSKKTLFCQSNSASNLSYLSLEWLRKVDVKPQQTASIGMNSIRISAQSFY